MLSNANFLFEMCWSHPKLTTTPEKKKKLINKTNEVVDWCCCFYLTTSLLNIKQLIINNTKRRSSWWLTSSLSKKLLRNLMSMKSETSCEHQVSDQVELIQLNLLFSCVFANTHVVVNLCNMLYMLYMLHTHMLCCYTHEHN